jgi:hypothetical protein
VATIGTLSDAVRAAHAADQARLAFVCWPVWASLRLSILSTLFPERLSLLRRAATFRGLPCWHSHRPIVARRIALTSAATNRPWVTAVQQHPLSHMGEDEPSQLVLRVVALCLGQHEQPLSDHFL